MKVGFSWVKDSTFRKTSPFSLQDHGFMFTFLFLSFRHMQAKLKRRKIRTRFRSGYQVSRIPLTPGSRESVMPHGSEKSPEKNRNEIRHSLCMPHGRVKIVANYEENDT